MPRIEYPALDSLNPEDRQIIEDARVHGTPGPEIQAILSHIPALLHARTQTWRTTFLDGVLDHRIKELCRVYVAKSIDCDYCEVLRSVQAEQQGLTEDDYDDLLKFEESDRFDERDKTALRFTNAVLWDASLADDALWENLHRHFTDPELVELGFYIGRTSGQQRWIKTLAVGHHEVLDDAEVGLAASPRTG